MRLAEVLRRHPFHLALAALIAGLVFSGARGWAVAIATASVPLVGLWTGRARLALLVGALVLAGAWIGIARRETIDRSQVGPFLGHAVMARGYVVKRERPVERAERFRMRLSAFAEPSGAWRSVSDLVQVRTRHASRLRLAIGQEIRVRGVLARLPGEREDQLEYSAYLRRAGVHALLRADSITPGGMRAGPVSVLDGLRRRAEVGVAAGLEPRLSALATGIVLGQDERISPEMVEQFQVSGLAHLLAVSGQNVTLLAVLALPILGALGLGRRARLIGVLGLIALYVPLTGAGPSIMRAGAMGAAATVAQLSGRPASRWYGLLLAGAFTLTMDPRAWLDAGWQLSFAAVAGIFCLGPRLRRALHMLPAPLAEGASLTVAATLATAPLLAFHFERLSVASLLANLIALPVVAPIMWLGTLAGAAAQVSTDAAALLNALNGFCLAYLAAVARWSAALPGAVAPLKIASPLTLAGAYLLLAAAIAGLALMRRALRSPSRPRARRALTLAAISLVIAIAWTAFLHGGDATKQPTRFKVTFLDVGQGDSTLLQAPRGVAVLVDGGPPDSGVAAKLRAAGVGSLDAMVLTHPQADHQGGLEAVLRAMPVRLLLDGGWREPVHDRIVALARSRGTRVVAAHAGMVLRIGQLRIRVMSPPGPTDDEPGEDPNQLSVVALVSYGTIDTLLTADAESDVTASLALSDIELLKVAHHGSADPGLASVLKRLHPEVAVIEVGEGNRYGHPHPQTLAVLDRSVPTVHRTDRDGDVTISQDVHGLTVATER